MLITNKFQLPSSSLMDGFVWAFMPEVTKVKKKKRGLIF